ncbi:MAG TPA: cation:proton antiporter, partial [Flavisolibacter sp.]
MTVRLVTSYIINLTIIGIAALGMAWMPSIARRTGISYSIFYVLLGVFLYKVLGTILPLPDPISKNTYTVRLTELVVIVSLMGSGLKIDQPFSLRRWTVPFRLVSITMVLSIIIVTVLAMWGLGFDLPAALLLGAVLAPTDPVLASDVQVGPPNEKVKDNVRFSLTAEAGMNDGTAFPFTWLAIILAGASASTSDIPLSWVMYELLYKIIAGLACGYLVGRGLAYMLLRIPEKKKFFSTKDGFVSISATLVVYGIAEMIMGYGFIAVFACAVTMRNFEMHHKYHKKMHDFSDQIERILVAIVLILFGGSLVSGILDQLTWEMVFFSFIFVLVIRPVTSLVGMIRTRLHLKEKLAIGFFGIKGVGSFFYLAFALNEEFFALNEELWAVGAFVVLLSITLHGLTATPVMKKIEMEFTDP